VRARLAFTPRHGLGRLAERSIQPPTLRDAPWLGEGLHRTGIGLSTADPVNNHPRGEIAICTISAVSGASSARAAMTRYSMDSPEGT
jgi:hypothetical protein